MTDRTNPSKQVEFVSLWFVLGVVRRVGKDRSNEP